MSSVTWCPEAGILGPEETSIAKQRLGKHIPAEANARNNRRTLFSVVRAARVANRRCGKHIFPAVNQYATTGEAVFSVGAAPRLHNEVLVRDKSIFSSERILYEDYYRGVQGASRQDELIGGKQPVVKWLWLRLELDLSRVQDLAVAAEHWESR
jgi:hypothetical protein